MGSILPQTERFSTWERPMAPLDPELSAMAEWTLRMSPREAERLTVTAPVGLLVGEDPGPRGNERLPLWPWPVTSAGGRLFAMSELSAADYLGRLARVNMVRRSGFRPSAGWLRHRAHQLMATLPDGCRVVLCGRTARDAFLDPDAAWWAPELLTITRGACLAVAVPHPSGRNRIYDEDPGARARTRDYLRWAAGLPAEDPSEAEEK